MTLSVKTRFDPGHDWLFASVLFAGLFDILEMSLKVGLFDKAHIIRLTEGHLQLGRRRRKKRHAIRDLSKETSEIFTTNSLPKDTSEKFQTNPLTRFEKILIRAKNSTETVCVFLYFFQIIFSC